MTKTSRRSQASIAGAGQGGRQTPPEVPGPPAPAAGDGQGGATDKKNKRHKRIHTTHKAIHNAMRRLWTAYHAAHRAWDEAPQDHRELEAAVEDAVWDTLRKIETAATKANELLRRFNKDVGNG